MEISPLDSRILRFTLEEGILDSERSIAKKLKISPSTPSFKLRKFEDKGIVTAYKYRVDFTKLGLNQVAWVLMEINHNGEGIKDLMDKLLEFPQVHVCLYISGQYSFCIKIYGKNKNEVNDFIEEIEKQFNNIIIDYKTYFITSQIKGHSQLIDENKKDFSFDEVDLKILYEKMQNPEISLNSVAKKLKLHRNTVSSRWNALCENKIVVKKTPIINPDLHKEMGIDFMGITLFKAVKGKENELEKELVNLKEVHELNALNYKSGYNLFVVIRTKNISTYYRLCESFFEKNFSGKIIETKNSIIIRSDSRRHTYLKDLGIETFVKRA